MGEYLAKMFRYMAWADRRTIESLRAAPAAHADALPLLAHLLAAEHVWLSRLQQRAPRLPVWPSLTLPECDTLAVENADGYLAFVGGLGAPPLEGLVRYHTSQGQEFVTPLIDILTQVITHGPYHRGQIARVIGRAGGEAINTDYITFAREVDPAG